MASLGGGIPPQMLSWSMHQKGWAMADKFSSDVRSRIMQRIRAVNTRPELTVRSFLHRSGLRFRLHDRTLPGRPDIVLPRLRSIVFVHGCFWHQHEGCRRATAPSGNRRYWIPKFQETVARDRASMRSLAALGWKVYVIWECQISQRRLSSLVSQIRRRECAPPRSTVFMGSGFSTQARRRS